MGEKIRIINNYNDFLDVELNKSTYAGGPRYIHIQNNKFRFCTTESEFLQISAAILKAGAMLKHNKRMDGESNGD